MWVLLLPAAQHEEVREVITLALSITLFMQMPRGRRVHCKVRA